MIRKRIVPRKLAPKKGPSRMPRRKKSSLVTCCTASSRTRAVLPRNGTISPWKGGRRLAITLMRIWTTTLDRCILRRFPRWSRIRIFSCSCCRFSWSFCHGLSSRRGRPTFGGVYSQMKWAW